MIEVFGITSSHSGFGAYQVAPESQKLPGYDTVNDYCFSVVRDNKYIVLYASDPDEAEMGDEDGERLAAAIRDATHNVNGGHATIVAFLTADNEIILESVEAIAE